MSDCASLPYNVPAIRPALEGSTPPSMKGCAAPRGGERMHVIGRSGGSAFVHVCSVVADGSRVCVSSFIGCFFFFFFFPLSSRLVIPTVSLHISCSQGCMEREGCVGGGGGTLGRKRVEKKA